MQIKLNQTAANAVENHKRIINGSYQNVSNRIAVEDMLTSFSRGFENYKARHPNVREDLVIARYREWIETGVDKLAPAETVEEAEPVVEVVEEAEPVVEVVEEPVFKTPSIEDERQRMMDLLYGRPTKLY